MNEYNFDDGLKLYRRNVNLDLIKILACFVVVLAHSLYIYEVNYTFLYGFPLAFSYFAIPFFIMATGYTLFNRSEISTAYTAHKIASILRLGALWSVIYALFHTVLSIIRGEEYSLLGTLATLPNKLLHALLGEERDSSFVVLWYLGALILVYACAYIIKKYNMNKIIVWLAVLFIGTTMQVASYAIGKSVQEYFTLTFRLWSWLQYALLGALMPDIVNVIKTKLPIWLHGILTAISIAVWLLFWKIVAERIFHDLYPERFYDSVFLITFSALFFSFLLRLSLSNKLSLLIEKICPLTVGTFLMHLPLIITGSIITYDTALYGFGSSFAIALIAAFLLTFLFSKLKFSRYLLKI